MKVVLKNRSVAFNKGYLYVLTESDTKTELIRLSSYEDGFSLSFDEDISRLIPFPGDDACVQAYKDGVVVHGITDEFTCHIYNSNLECIKSYNYRDIDLQQVTYINVENDKLCFYGCTPSRENVKLIKE